MSCSVSRLLDCYSKLVLAAVEDSNDDPLWKRFYTIQMSGWILTRKNLDFVLSDAIKAYSLINEAWEDLDYYMQHSLLPVKNFDNVFKMVRIPFETTKYTISSLDNNDLLIFGSK